MPPAATTEERFVCEEPDCGRSYSRSRALRRHLTQSHGYPPSEKTAKNRKKVAVPDTDGTPAARVRAHLAELTTPLREELTTIDKQIEGLSNEIEAFKAAKGREIKELREMKKQIERTLRGLSGKPASNIMKRTAASAGTGNRFDQQAKLEAVERYLTSHADGLTEGFTAAEVHRWMAEEGTYIAMAPDKVRDAINVLHERGVVRADRITRGGGQSFVLIGGSNGEVT